MPIIFPDIDPVAFSIGPLDIRWYALAYLAGFLLGWRYCIYLTKFFNGSYARPTKDDIDNLLSWIVLGVVLGGRFGYVLFYQFDFYAANPGEILKIWRGGMSFHGGLLGSGLAIYLFSLKYKVSYMGLFDLVAAAAPIGVFFGRIANFVNGELYGRVTDVGWGIVFPTGGGLPRHPSQLYQAVLEGALLWLMLFIFIIKFNALNKKGLLTGLFLCGYSIARFVVEFFRMPDEHLGFMLDILTMGQILSIPMFLIGCVFIYLAYIRNETHKGSYEGQA